MNSQEGTTQGDPLAMAMYAVGIAPLTARLRETQVQQVWYADDASAASELKQLRDWWDHLTRSGPDYGYFPNAAKTWLIVKEGMYIEAASTFQGTGINLSTEGKRFLGGALGSRSFVESYVATKVEGWKKELETLSEIAQTQPHAAYAALTHGFCSKWSFLSRVVEGIDKLLKPLEEVIVHKLIPALTGRSAISQTERELLSLPARLG